MQKEKKEDLPVIDRLEDTFSKYQYLQDSITSIKRSIIDTVCKKYNFPKNFFDIENSFLFKTKSGEIAIALYRQIFKQEPIKKYDDERQELVQANKQYAWEFTFILKSK